MMVTSCIYRHMYACEAWISYGLLRESNRALFTLHNSLYTRFPRTKDNFLLIGLYITLYTHWSKQRKTQICLLRWYIMKKHRKRIRGRLIDIRTAQKNSLLFISSIKCGKIIIDKMTINEDKQMRTVRQYWITARIPGLENSNEWLVSRYSPLSTRGMYF